MLFPGWPASADKLLDGQGLSCSVARLLGCSVARLLGCSVARFVCSVVCWRHVPIWGLGSPVVGIQDGPGLRQVKACADPDHLAAHTGIPSCKFGACSKSSRFKASSWSNLSASRLHARAEASRAPRSQNFIPAPELAS